MRRTLGYADRKAPRGPAPACAAALLATLLATAPSSHADDHAVILIYHHVATGTPASTSVTPDTFAKHVDYLEKNDFHVVPLIDVVTKLDGHAALPDNSVAITFDDAYRSVYTTARPMLEIRGWPYTVFVSTEYIDGNYDNYMSWEELREIAGQGATIGNHGVSHASALARGRQESEQDWLQRFRADVVAAQERISTETGAVPKLYAWPYGEFNDDVEPVIARLGWYGFGQQSGAAGYDSSMTSLPRFPLAAGYDGMDDFTLRVRSEPLPIAISAAPERLLASGDPAPELAFRLVGERYNQQALNCYNSRGDRLAQTRSGETYRIHSETALPVGRSKYTCTAPRLGGDGVFGWYSHLWVVRD